MEMLEKLLCSDALIVILLSITGGTGSFMQGCRSGNFEGSFFNFSTEIILSLTTGLCLYFLGTWLELTPALINSLVLLLTNNGGDTLARGKELLSTLLKNKLN